MLERGAILYIDVSWAESLRKNRARAHPERPDSILQHSLSDEKLARLYRESDWAEFSGGDPQRIAIQGVSVPYAIFANEDDVTTARGPALGQRLEQTLARLWGIYRAA
jgi:ABC-type microcin C transport system duplicated ATPase subunit YejF